MKVALWGSLAVLLGLGVAAAEGELCRVWVDGLDSPIEIFGCPRPGAWDVAKFCCGSCLAPHCCSLKEDRLDQQQCLADARSKPTRPPQPPSPNYQLLLIMGLVSFAALALSIFIASVHCLFVHQCLHTLHCLKSRNKEPQPIEMQVIDSPSRRPLVDSTSSLIGPSTSHTATEDTVPPSPSDGTSQVHQALIPELDNNTSFVWFHLEHSGHPGDGATTSSPAPVPVGEAASNISNLL